MRKNTGKFVVALCAFFSAFGLAPAGAPTLVGNETQVTTAAADQFDPAVSGNIVVYTDFSGVDADVWYTDMSTGQAHPVIIAEGDQQLTDVSGTRIVYTNWNTMDVMVFDMTSGQTANLTYEAGSNALDPSISGNLVVWTDDRHGNAEIYARDLATGEERRITNSLLVDESAAVADGIIAWERCEGFACDILSYDWATGVTVVVTPGTPYETERFPDVFGRTIAFQRERGTPIDKDVAFYNLDTGTKTVLELPGDQENAHVSGDFISFNDSASGIPHIGIWQISTGAHFAVPTGPSGQYLNAIDGQRVVYSDTRAGTLDIWAFDFTIDSGEPPNQPPTFTPPADITTVATSTAGAVVHFTANGHDAEDGAIAAVCAPPSGSTFPLGMTTVTCTVTDSDGATAAGSFTVTVVVANSAPLCSAAQPSISTIWPPNHQLVDVNILGVIDPDGGAVTINVTGIFQDEPTNAAGTGNTPIDGYGIGTATAQVRAERLGSGTTLADGRVYHIYFTAMDAQGASCTGEVKVAVPHDRGKKGGPAMDGGALFSSSGS